MSALAKWLSWEGNELRVRYHPDGLSNLWTDPEWSVLLSAPLGSFIGSRGETLPDALANLEAELAKRASHL